MAKSGYSVVTPAAVALAAATAKSVLSVVPPASFGLDLTGFELGFDGVAASAVPTIIEICSSTQATAGTSTAATPAQEYGRVIAHGTTAAYNFTVEPTVLTVLRKFPLTPTGGTIVRDFPLGQTIDIAPSAGLILRVTAPAAVNVTATLRFERC